MEEERDKEDIRNIENRKMAHINSALLILNLNEVSIPGKRQRIEQQIK